MRFLIAIFLVLSSYSFASAQNIRDIVGSIIGAAIQQNQQRYNQQHQPMPPQMPRNGYSSPTESHWAKDDPPPRSSTPHGPEAGVPQQHDNLGACDEGNALAGLKYQVLNNPASGLGAISEFMIVDEVIPLGINNIDGSKMCKATFHCDMDAARAKEAGFYGAHRLSAMCYQLNQTADAGNAAWLRFSIKPNGEGGTIITPYGY